LCISYVLYLLLIINSATAIIAANNKINKCSDRNSTVCAAFLNKRPIKLPKAPGNARIAFFARSSRRFATLTKTCLIGFVGLVGGRPEGTPEPGVGKTDKTMVDIVIPMAVIRAPIVTPSLLNNSFSLSANDRDLSLTISFIRLI